MDTGGAAPLRAAARELARRTPAAPGPGRGDLAAHLRALERSLSDVHSAFHGSARVAVTHPRISEWLLDNEYLTRRALREVREAVPRGFYRKLPRVAPGGGPAEGGVAPEEGTGARPTELRVYRVAHAMLRQLEFRLVEEELEQFVDAYQDERDLTMGELWALPAMLRLAALEELESRVAPLPSSTAAIFRPRPSAAESSGGDRDPVTRVAACIETLRLCEELDWRDVFEATSRVERILREDPSGDYPRMDFETRDRYRKAVEEVADAGSAGEVGVARAAVRMARAAGREAGPGRTRRRAHVGRFLLGEDRPGLEERVGARAARGTRRLRWVRRRATPLYLGSVGLSAAVALGLLLGLVAILGGGPADLAWAAVAAAVPSLTLAVALVHWAAVHLVPRRVLPKLDFDEGIPEEWRTVVAVPCLLGDRGEVRALLRKLETLRETTGDGALAFVLLSDFTDAPEPSVPGDERLLAAASEGVRALNREHAPDGGPGPFLLLHRSRRWNEAEGRWMGWERKRGKLAQLDRLLVEGVDDFDVREGDLAALDGARFVLTLDADTRLPPGMGARLVGTLAHPLNRPEFDDDGGVRAGYTVLQPRVETDPMADDEPTWFRRFYEGEVGLDLYSRAVSEVYQDLFGEGIYVGKGIYDVRAFRRALRGAVPENALLSHDLFEGLSGRAGLVSDVVVLEDYPSHVLAYTRRLHRWIRGDWQLLPWLLPVVPAAGGGARTNPFDALGRWKIFDNLRRSLLAPSLVALLAAGWLAGPGSAWIWVAVTAAVPAVPVFLGAAAYATRRLARAGRPPPEVARATWGSRLRRAGTRLGTEGVRWLTGLVLLLHEASVAVDAVARTLYRLTISRRHLLEWTSAARAARELRRRGDRLSVWREMAPAPVGAAVLAAACWLAAPASLGAAIPVCALWAISPEVAWLVSRPVRVGVRELTAEDVRFLRDVALRTWLFFERHTDSEHHWLPPDNVGGSGEGEVAGRTSPTNMGMMLVSALAAYDLGYTGPLALEALLRNTVESMGALERHRGHFFNWYATRTREALEPRYVSTVDSGNLAAALVVLRGGAEDVARRPALRPEQADGLLDAVRILAGVFRGLAGGERPESRDAAEEATEILRRIAGRVRDVRDDPAGLARLLVELEEETLPPLERCVAEAGGAVEAPTTEAPLLELRIWSRKLRQQVAHTRREVRTFHPWLERRRPVPGALLEDRLGATSGPARRLERILAAPHALARLPARATAALRLVEGLREAAEEAPGDADHRREVLTWASAMSEELRSAGDEAHRCASGLRELGAAAAGMVEEMDFRFLYDPRRHLFHIGYTADSGELDPHHYDLLASEARLASLVAVSRGQVPPEHWIHLGRPFAPFGTVPALLSWSGTMFEYLLPAHFSRSPRRTLLDRSCRVAVERQIRYGRSHGVPWGVSESAYRSGEGETYGYRAFGVPELGLRRDPVERFVVAPYASALALAVDPVAAVRNLVRLAELGALDTYGFYDALDYGPAPARSGAGLPVRTYMAHHQGMVLAAVANRLADEVMVERFHADPGVEGSEHLLAERIPWQVPRRRPWVAPERPRAAVAAPTALTAWSVDPGSPVPHAVLLAGGDLRAVVTGAGGGGLRWKDVALTRWDPDPTREAGGPALYVQDVERGALWSVSDHPAGAGGEASVHFAPHEAEFRRRHQGLTAEVRVLLTTGGLEVRRLALTNLTDRPRRLAVTSFGEVALADPEADRRHPAFEKLFVESRRLEEEGVLLFRRRGREPGGEQPWLAHGVHIPASARLARWTDSREEFLGRGGGPGSPGFLEAGVGPAGRPWSGGPAERRFPLDPAFALGVDLRLGAGEATELTFVTGAGPDRAELVDRIRAAGPARTALLEEEARAARRSALARRGIEPEEAAALHRLASGLLFPFHGLRAGEEASGGASRQGLWRHGISGDLPLLLLEVERDGDLSLADRLVRAHGHWRELGLPVDLVLLDLVSSGYSRPLRDRLVGLVERRAPGRAAGGAGGVHVLVGAETSEGERASLRAAASVVLSVEAGRLEEQLRALDRPPTRLPEFVPVPSGPLDARRTPPLEPAEGLAFDNGWGGFEGGGAAYAIRVDPDEPTPAPWANVVGGTEAGFVATEAGLGCTWVGDAGENRLTPWRNDPVRDEPSEVVWLRDEETGDVWSATPGPGGGRPYRARHGPGHTSWEHRRRGLDHRLRAHAPPDGPAVKLVDLRLRDLWDRDRRITVTFYAEWVLGTHRARTAGRVEPSWDAEERLLTARDPFRGPDGSRRVAFLGSDRPPHGFTADRAEFLGRNADPRRPAGLERIGLSDTARRGVDPCAAYQVHLDVPAGGTAEVRFFLGEGGDPEEAARLAREARVAPGWEGTRDRWEEVLGRVAVRTPEPAMDLLLNRWLPYQTLSSRVRARTALYQSSGAFGFRDQLQDVLSLLHHAPGLARRHLLRAASRQFEEGDVLHWWQPDSRRGVRTRCSDDLLWLPHAVAAYVRATGDREVLDEDVPFLRGPELEPGETERYAEFDAAPAASLFEHCLRAVDRGSTAGRHGLPLMGSGDWNDGMNRVGVGGEGESVWLGWFLHTVLEDVAALCRGRGQEERADGLRARAAGLLRALETAGWDGAWYRRAYHDDGTPLGTRGAAEAEIDGISQAWAVLSGAADPDRARAAMSSAWRLLVREEEGLVLLLTPPFEQPERDPGYIAAYPPGVRENGGQYTHAGAWLGLAFAELGDAERAWAIFDLLNPVRRTAGSRGAVRRYRVEPYVQAADVYSVEPHVGRGGWTWYTGSAGWTYRLGLEGILGLRRVGEELRLRPCPPAGWGGYEIVYRTEGGEHAISVELPEGRPVRVAAVEVDGVRLEGTAVPLARDGARHEVRVVCEVAGGGRPGNRDASPPTDP